MKEQARVNLAYAFCCDEGGLRAVGPHLARCVAKYEQDAGTVSFPASGGSTVAKLKLAWLAPDDRAGGVISVVEAVCRQASSAGHHATLLLMTEPTGRAAEFGGCRVATLAAEPPFRDAPRRLLAWLTENPQDVLFLNGCREVEGVVPHVPAPTRVVSVIHDTAERYFSPSLANEDMLDGIVAVSGAVADRFRHRIKDPKKLSVLHNGSVFPVPVGTGFARTRDLLFMGGDKPTKGAYDVLAVWPKLLDGGFDGRLHWFGSIGSRFRARVACAPASERIVVHGHVPRSRLFEAALRASTLLMLSRTEPFGMATVEAMGMGCTIAAWNIDTGTREIATGPGEAEWAPLGDFEALAGAILAALDRTDEERAAILARVRAVFGEEAMWRRYSSFLQRLQARQIVGRPLEGEPPGPYRPPIRLFQLVPRALRSSIRRGVGQSTRLGYILRDCRE